MKSVIKIAGSCTQSQLVAVMNHRRSLLKFCLVGLILIFSAQNTFSQLTGIKTIPGDYATITAAVAAVNTAGVGAGGVIFNVAAGFEETITSTISLTATGTAANTIIFQKDPATTGANPAITTYTGGTGTPGTALQDGVWRLLGSDYVTIDGIDLKGNPANTTNPSTMEYGYALYKVSATNGCQYVTITNCVITLSRINNAAGTAPMVDGSTGILVVNSTATAAITPLTVTSSAGSNSYNNFYNNTIQNCNTGIALIGFAAATPFSLADQGNDVGGTLPTTGNRILNFGGAAGATVAAVGIRTLAQYNLNVANNIINNNNGAGVNHETTLRGIYINAAVSAASDITNNTISLKSASTTTITTGIENASGSTAVGNEVNISNNTISNCTATSATTGSFYGIYNLGSAAILSINNNTFNNITTSATSGTLYTIYNNAAVGSTININNNSISGINFSAATATSFIGVYNLLGAATASLTVTNNEIAGISYSALSTAANTYIINSAATLSQNISANNFTNINVNTTGAITFISNSVIVPATGNQVVDDNNIVGTFTRAGTATSGALTLFTSSATNATGSVISNSNNDFSNITVSGAATIAGWVNTDAGSSLKTIQGNNFINWTGGTGAITALTVNLTGTTNATVSNIISNISSAGLITGISTAAGNDNIYANTISNLVSTGGAATTVTGIYVLGGTTKNIYQNIISGISANNSTTGNATAFVTATGIWVAAGTTVNVYENKISAVSANVITSGTVNGIAISGGTTISAYRNKIYNISSASAAISTGGVSGLRLSGTTASSTTSIRSNIIGDLRATAANNADAIRGISLISTGTTSNVYVYYNTIYLNAASTGTNFGSSGIYHTGAVSSTASLDLINNIILNTSVPNGTGLTVAYRRSNTTLTNYGASSNNNLYYAGVPAANRLIFSDGAVSDQTLAAFKTRMATRDAASVTEDLLAGNVFLSTTGSSANYLHMDNTKTSVVKSGGVSISGITLDFDNDIRWGNAGYAGTGSAPDIGADEYAGISYLPLSGTYNVGTGQTFASLTNAGGLFAKINRSGLGGNIIANITSDLTETGLEALNEWTETGAGTYTVLIQPATASTKVISGDVLKGMIRLDGADRVTIDGGAGKYLTFRNTNTAGTTGAALSFINGASGNIIRRSNFEAFTDINNGVILFSTSATFDGGNSNNLVELCNINGTVGVNSAIVCLLSAGTNVSGFENINNTIQNNNIYDYKERGLGIKSTGSYAWTISDNSFYNGNISAGITYANGSTLHGLRILGGYGYTVANNFIGGNAPGASGTNATYATTSGNLSYQGILVNTSGAVPETNIKGNTIAKINVTTFPIVASSTVFIGIETNGSGINTGGRAIGEGNIIGSNTSNASIVVTTSTATNTSTSFIRGINNNSSGGVIMGNKIGGIDIKNIGAAPAPSYFLGIYVNNPMAPAKINNNIVGSYGTGAATNSIQVVPTSTATTTSLTGISVGTSVGNAISLDSNIISSMSHLASVATTGVGGIIGINTAAKNTSEIVVSNNSFVNNSNNSTMALGVFYGVQNVGASASLKINQNTVAGNTIASTTTIYNAIRNTGVVFNSIDITGNYIGNASSAVVNFNAANSAAHIFINNTGGSSSANLNISNNDFQYINYVGSNGTGANTLISNTATTLSQTINNNSFTNLNIQTSGSVTLIANSVVVPSAGFQTINNNFIAGTFTKKAGGTVTITTSTATCATGSTININNNSFSNINISGLTVLNGIVNTDAGSSFKSIQGNLFSNWVGGTSAITVMTVNLTSTNNAVTGNIIRNISAAASITGITTAAGNDNIYANTIDSLNSTGAVATIVSGINVTAGTTKNIYQNIISNLQGNSITSGSVRGIWINAGATVNFYQNTIYGFTANNLTTGTLAGVWVAGGATVAVYRNKIYDIACSNNGVTSPVYGIVVSGTTANLNCTINNNMIGDLRSPLANIAEAVRGIGITSTGTTSVTNVYYNTIYLNATSTGTNFGTSGIYHLTSVTATTSALNLINNSISNFSVARGTGLTVAYRRSSATLTNYGSTSNNNMFYAGVPSATNLIYFDATNSDQTIAAFKARVASRDAASISEDLIATNVFISTVGSAVTFLHMDPNKTTTLKSAGINIAGFTDDFDGDIRFGNPGYAGNGSAPDIGADEFAGLQFLPFSGIYNVGIGQNYTSLTNTSGIFAKMNSLGFSGHVTINIVSDLSETGAEALNQWNEIGAGNYNLVIQPDGISPRLISGNVVAGMIRFNGPDRVRVDGGTNKLLTFRNTNTTGTSGTAFTLINGATYDTIRNCNLEAYANATNGVVLFSTAASSTVGNSFNLLEQNNINGKVGANSSLVAIYSAGTTSKPNASNVIRNNDIFDFRDNGIAITATGSTGWTISNNSFYNGAISGAVNYPASSELHGIIISGGSGYTISNNFIGGTAALATGTNAVYASTLGNITYHGIVVTTTNPVPATNIKSNTVNKITINFTPVSSAVNAFIGIETNGSGINIGGVSSEGNTIGSNTINGAILISTTSTSTSFTSIIKGINFLSSGGILNSNQVGGFDISNLGTAPASSTFTGIYVNNASAPSQVNANTIGSNGSGASSNSVRILGTSAASNNFISGIEFGNSVASAVTINGNYIQNIGNLSTTSSGSFTGINNTAIVSAAVMTMNNNTIRNINTGINNHINSTIFTGINSSSPSIIFNDTIANFSLAATGTAAQLRGIMVSGAFAHIIHSNYIADLSSASTKTGDVETGLASNYTVCGIVNAASAAGQLIYGNTLYRLSSTSTDVTNAAVAGIGVTTAGFSGSIYNNRIIGFTNAAAGTVTLPGITGIAVMAGTGAIYNNVINLSNAANINGIKVYGINHSASTTWSYFYNTINIGGNATGTVARSAAFVRTVNGIVTIENNILYNTRTGTGNNYGISNKVASPATNWNPGACDYNNIFSATAGTTGEWGNAGTNSFAQWQTNSGGDARSLNRSVSFIASTFDLQLNPNSNCGLDNAGLAITWPIAIVADINAVTRHASTPDIGAYEFAFVSFVVTASNSSPICTGSNLNLTSTFGTAISPSFSWKNPANLVVSTIQNPTVTGVAGAYTITITDINGCVAVPVTTTVSVHAAPSTSLSYVGTPYCSNLELATLTFTGTTGGVFSSTPGLTLDSSNGSVVLSSSTLGTYKVLYTVNGACVTHKDSTTITLLQAGKWLGGTSADWNNALNWPCNIIPNSTKDVTIANGVSFYPVISATNAAVRDIIIQSGASVTVQNNMLQVSGTVTNNGTLNATDGGVEYNGASAQNIPANLFSGNQVKDLTIRNAAGVTLNGPLAITGTLAVPAGTFNTNNNLALKSTATGSARVAALPVDGSGNATTFINGNVSIERFIPMRKGWRLLSAPVKSAGAPTINQAWQEGLTTASAIPNLYPGYGIHIIAGTVANGYDIAPTSTTTIKIYSNSANNFITLPTTPGTNAPITSYPGYFVYIRGDRGTNLALGVNAPASVATLRMKGAINTGKITTAVNAVNYTVLGNPYPSAIDFETITKTNVRNGFYVWDPKLAGTFGLGAYVAFSWNSATSSYDATTSASPLSQYIASGEAVLIESEDGITPGTITIKETDKTANGSDLVFGRYSGLPQKMRVNLHASTNGVTSLLDGVLTTYDDNNSNAVDKNDAKKLSGASESIGIKRSGIMLAIERRTTITATDTCFLNIYQMKIQSYQLEIQAENLDANNTIAILKDSYSNTINNLALNTNGTTIVPFSITSDPASYAIGRFSIVYTRSVVLPVTFKTIKANARQKNVVVDWTTESEINVKHYEVERSGDARSYEKLGTQQAQNNGLAAVYQFTDSNPLAGNNYYRIRSVDHDGQYSYSSVVKVAMQSEKTMPAVLVYPNPVTGNTVSMQLNNIVKGKYTLQLFSETGQLVVMRYVKLTDSFSQLSFEVGDQFAAGKYELLLKGEGYSLKTTLLKR